MQPWQCFSAYLCHQAAASKQVHLMHVCYAITMGVSPATTARSAISVRAASRNRPLASCLTINDILWCRFAAKVITKRWGPAGAMEPLFVKRMQHEVDICNHVGKTTLCCGHRSRCMHFSCFPCLACLFVADRLLARGATIGSAQKVHRQQSHRQQIRRQSFTGTMNQAFSSLSCV